LIKNYIKLMEEEEEYIGPELFEKINEEWQKLAKNQ
jgi:hypothetical protein